jgi:uncharacterized protein YjbJ (UPF0337 family)
LIGKVTGDARLRGDGQADKAKGVVQSTVGGIKDSVRIALKM